MTLSFFILLMASAACRSSVTNSGADPLSANPGTSYRVLHKIAVGGDGSWDYITLDSPGHRLFVAHGTKVDIVDIGGNRVVGEIPNTLGVHGVVLPPDSTKGFISCGKAGVVKVFDRKSLAVTGEIQTGKNPDAIVYDPVSSRVFVSNGSSESLSVIDPVNEKVVATIPVQGKPEYAVSDERGVVWVNLEDKNETVAIDSKGLTVKNRVALPGCDEPSSLAMDTENRRLFAGCGNRIMAVIDPDAGQVIASLPVGEHIDATVFDPETRLVFNSCGDGTVTVIHQDSPDRYRVVEIIETERGAKTMALDFGTKRIFLPTAENLPQAATGPPRPGGPSFPLGQFVVLVVGK